MTNDYPENLLIERALYRSLVTEMSAFVHDVNSWITSLHISLDMMQAVPRERLPRAVGRAQETVRWAQEHLAALMPLLSATKQVQTATICLDDFFKKYHHFFVYLANNRQLIRPHSEPETAVLKIRTEHFVPDISANETRLLLVVTTLLQLLYGTAQGVSRISADILRVSERALQTHINYIDTPLSSGEYIKIQFDGSDIALDTAVSRWQTMRADTQGSRFDGAAVAVNLILQDMNAGLWLTTLPTGQTAALVLLPMLDEVSKRQQYNDNFHDKAKQL